MRFKVVVGREQFVLALQFHTPMRQLAVEFVDLRYVLSKQGRPAQQWKGAIHHIGIGNDGKGVGVSEFLSAQLLAHARRNRL